MQIKKKSLIISLIVVVIALIIGIIIFTNIKKNKINADYYYNFVYDDNKITQSVKVYNNQKKLQTNYYVIYNNEPVSYTKGEKAVVTINAIDLKNKPNIYIAFEDDINKKYEVVYKK